jgi:hypothetical protein
MHEPELQGTQQGADQPTPRRTKLRNGTFPGFVCVVRLGLGLPSIFRRRRSFSAGRSPAAGPPRGRGGGGGGGAAPPPPPFGRWRGGGGPGGPPPPPPSDLCAVYGRERASGPTRRAKCAKKWFALRSWAQRDLVKTSR